MKKQLIVLVLSIISIFLVGTCALAESSLNIGFDFGGQQKITNPDRTDDTDSGISIGYEYVIPQDQLKYGFGVEYQFERSIKSPWAPGNGINSIPIYGILNINLSDNKEIQPYVAARLGYCFFMANDAWKGGSLSTNGGLYYAIGLGVDFKLAKAEALYMVNNGSTSNNRDVTYSTWGIKVGYKF